MCDKPEMDVRNALDDPNSGVTPIYFNNGAVEKKLRKPGWFSTHFGKDRYNDPGLEFRLNSVHDGVNSLNFIARCYQINDQQRVLEVLDKKLGIEIEVKSTAIIPIKVKLSDYFSEGTPIIGLDQILTKYSIREKP